MRRAVLALVVVLVTGACSVEVAEEITTTVAATTTTMAPATTSPSTSATTSTLTSTTTTVLPTSTTGATTSATVAETTTTTMMPVWWREATRDDPLRVWVIGDSLAGPVGRALAARGEAISVLVTTVDYQSGTGLASPQLRDWPEFVGERMPQVAPDVVVTVIGANDGQGMSSPDGWVEFGTPEWDARYGAVVGEFMDQIAADSSRVYWVGMPIMASPNYAGRVRHMNAIHREQAALRLAVVFVDAYTLFQDETGHYAAALPDEQGDLVRMRDADGVHYTTAGAQRMADRVLGRLAADWGLPPLLGG